MRGIVLAGGSGTRLYPITKGVSKQLILWDIKKTVHWYLDNQEWLDNVTFGDYQKYYEQQYYQK